MDRKFIEEKIIILKECARKGDINAFNGLIERIMEDGIFSRDIGFLIETGVSFGILNKPAEAEKFFLKALDINSKDKYALKGLVKTLLLLQDYDGIKKHIGSLLENYDLHKEYFLQLIKQITEKMYCHKDAGDEISIVKISDLFLYMSRYISDKKTENILINEAEIAQNKTVLKSMPRKLELRITSRCNIRCKMCNIPHDDWTFPESKNQELLNLMPYLEEIIWHGGEPLLYPHIYGLIEEASKNNVKQAISTNALLLDENNIRKLLATNIELNVSIHGLDKKTYESIHINGDFDKLVSNLSLIKKVMSESTNKMKYGFKFLLMKSNYNQIPDICEFVKQYGFNHVYINVLDEFTETDEKILYHGEDRDILERIIRMSNVLREKLKEINVFYEAWIPEPEKDQPCCEKENVESIHVKNKTGCYMPWKKIHIGRNGNVRNDCFCGNLMIGNIVEKTMENIWNGETVLKVRENIINKGFDPVCSDGCKDGRVPEKYLKSF